MSALPPFSGTPQRYWRVAVAMGVLSHAYLYFGLLLIEYVWWGRDWMLQGPAIVTTLGSALALTVFAYVAMMYLDVRWERGGSGQTDRH